jgi:putative oxidoreductase
MIRKKIFSAQPSQTVVSSLLMVARLIFGLVFLNHGVEKWVAFDEIATSFPDPLGIGSEISLLLAIFAELFCSVAFIFGFLYRLALIPMIATMAIAFFLVHNGQPFTEKELSLLYLVIFVLMYISGPGKYSIDSLLRKRYEILCCSKSRKTKSHVQV